MLEIFHIPRTRSQRIIWLAEEMGLPYEIRRETFGQPSAELLAAILGRSKPSATARWRWAS